MKSTNIYLFNPTCETAIANGSETYVPPQILQTFEADLACLPSVFCKKDDFVLCPYQPSKEFTKQLKAINFPIPDFITQEQLPEQSNHEINKLILWGWSPSAHFRLKKIKQLISGNFRESKIFNWNPAQKALFERNTSLCLLTNFLSENNSHLYCTNVIPEIIGSLDEAKEFLNLQGQMVLKSPVSSSGRGIQMIRNKELNESNIKWIESVLKQQKYVVAEPLHQRLIDISFQYEIIANSEVRYIGHSFFFTNKNGMYLGNFLNHQLCNFNIDCAPITDDFIHQTGVNLKQTLAASHYAKHYEGLLGIDAMIIKSDEGIKIYPCNEVNCRLNMGILSLQIEQFIHPDARGKFEIYSAPKADYKQFVIEKQQQFPISMKNEKLFKGFVSLTDFIHAKKFGAYIVLD